MWVPTMVLINIISGSSNRVLLLSLPLSHSYPRSGNFSDRIPECWHNPGIIFWAALVNFLQSEIICLRFLYKSPSVKVSRSNLQTVSLFLLFSNSLLFYFCFDVLSSLPPPLPQSKSIWKSFCFSHFFLLRLIAGWDWAIITWRTIITQTGIFLEISF